MSNQDIGDLCKEWTDNPFLLEATGIVGNFWWNSLEVKDDFFLEKMSPILDDVFKFPTSKKNVWWKTIF